jgi:uncharacterized protein (TIGR01244 family)
VFNPYKPTDNFHADVFTIHDFAIKQRFCDKRESNMILGAIRISAQIRVFSITVISLLLAACASTPAFDLEAVQAAEIINLRAPEGATLSSGQPTAAQLGIVARSGVRHVINLRTAGEEVAFNESEVADSLGMEYHSIPVAGGAGINADNAQALADILAGLNGEPVLIHCATGNRVGGLMALSSFADGASVDSAVAEGARWGMTSERLQAIVRESLSDN